MVASGDARTPKSNGNSSTGNTASSRAKATEGGSDAGEGGGATREQHHQHQQKEDKNRHNPQESSIFSPALRPEHHDEVGFHVCALSIFLEGLGSKGAMGNDGWGGGW